MAIYSFSNIFKPFWQLRSKSGNSNYLAQRLSKSTFLLQFLIFEIFFLHSCCSLSQSAKGIEFYQKAIDPKGCKAMLNKERRKEIKKYINKHSEEYFGVGKEYCRKDYIFQKDELRTPILFAHRGGVMEKPEGTIMAFNHANDKAEAEVLELDVQITKDGEYVVWHGPSLEGVCQRNIDMAENKINECNWDAFDDKYGCQNLKEVWIRDPTPEETKCEDCNFNQQVKCSDYEDVSGYEISQRKLLLLDEFLEKYRDRPLNIEMKRSFQKYKRKVCESDKRDNGDHIMNNVREFLEILCNRRNDRTIVIAVGICMGDVMKRFRILNDKLEDPFPTNLTPREQLTLKMFNTTLNENRIQKGQKFALETFYLPFISNECMIKKTHAKNGSTFVFLTGFGPLQKSLEKTMTNEVRDEIFNILDRGVDGIMTDRPECVRNVIDLWLLQKESEIKKKIEEDSKHRKSGSYGPIFEYTFNIDI